MKRALITWICLMMFAASQAAGPAEWMSFSKIELVLNKGVMTSKGEITQAQYASFIKLMIESYGENSDRAKFFQAPANPESQEPMLGLNYKQVREYFSWASEEATRKLHQYKAEHPNEAAPRLLIFRLPTEAELQNMLDVKNPEMTVTNGVAVDRNKKSYNYKATDTNLAFRAIVEPRN